MHKLLATVTQKTSAAIENQVISTEEITTTFKSFTLIPNAKYRFTATSVNATNWRYALKFYKSSIDVTTSVTQSKINMLDYPSLPTFYLLSAMIMNDVNQTGKSFEFNLIDADRVDIKLIYGTTNVSSTTTGNQQILVVTKNPAPPPSNYVDGNALFSLVADSANDQTSQLSAMMNSSYDNIQLTAGEYKSGPITVTAGVDKEIYCPTELVIKFTLTTGQKGIDIYTNLYFHNITFDFNNTYCTFGLLFRQNIGLIKANNVMIKNVKDIDNTSASNLLYCQAKGNTFAFDDVSFLNCLKRGNGNISDAGGSMNCLVITDYESPGQPIIGYARNTNITNIHCINSSDVIIFEDTSGIYLVSLSDYTDFTLYDTVGYNSGKRLIKGDCNNLYIYGVNSFDDTQDKLAVIGQNNAYGANNWIVDDVYIRGTAQIGIVALDNGHRISNLDIELLPAPLIGTSDTFAIYVSGRDIQVTNFALKAKRIVYATDIDSGLSIQDIILDGGTWSIPSDGSFGMQIAVGGFDRVSLKNIAITDSRLSNNYNGAIFNKVTTVAGTDLLIENVAFTSSDLNAIGVNVAYCNGLDAINIDGNITNQANRVVTSNCTNVDIINI